MEHNAAQVKKQTNNSIQVLSSEGDVFDKDIKQKKFFYAFMLVCNLVLNTYTPSEVMFLCGFPTRSE